MAAVQFFTIGKSAIEREIQAGQKRSAHTMIKRFLFIGQFGSPAAHTAQGIFSKAFDKTKPTTAGFKCMLRAVTTGVRRAKPVD